MITNNSKQKSVLVGFQFVKERVIIILMCFYSIY